MNTNEARKIWIEALRSGKYQQGEGYLKVFSEEKGTFQYCCLGVACEIFKETLNLREEEENRGSSSFNGLGLIPPGEIVSLLGLHTAYGNKYGDAAEEEFQGASLVDLNDELKLSFEEIAEVLEKQSHLYFKN